MDKIFLEEKKKVKDVSKYAKNTLAELQKKLEEVGAANLARLRELREEGEFGPDFLMFLERLHEKNESFNIKDKFKRVEELGYLVKNPFFARIDLSEKKQVKKIYIGKFGLSDGKHNVTDWRAKVASVYYRYRYPQKNVYYDTPAGVEKRDLLLKRTYEIDNGELIKYYNNDLQLDENEIIIERIGKKTGGVLEDIVETIQKSQMDIIESDPRQICVVQGCVGSGKSTVAIHKLAHIFFNYPNLIHSERSIVVAKNQILVGYLSTLFPQLGIFDTNYKTVREILVNLIFREEIQVKTDLDTRGSIEISGLKNLKEVFRVINKIHAEYEKKIDDIFSTEEFETFGGYKYSPSLSPVENIEEILSELEEELSNQKDELKDLPNDSIKAYMRKENIKVLRKLIAKLTEMKNEIKIKVVAKVASRFGISINSTLNYNEALLYVYIYISLIGIYKHPIYEYCVVDEAQDFLPIEFALLSKVVLRGRFGVFGDLNQSLENGGISDWNELSEIIKEARSSVRYELSTNYRSTKPIVEFAKDILAPYTKKFLPYSINRAGKEPEIFYYDSEDGMIQAFLKNLENDVTETNKSVGVVCYDDSLLPKITEQIKNSVKDSEYY